MNWFILMVAGFFEIGWAVGLKYSDGFSKLWLSVGTIAAMLISIFLLSVAMKTLPLGTAYAVWTGIGTIGSVIFGVIFLGDPATAWRFVCVGLIVSGIIGLKLLS